MLPTPTVSVIMAVYNTDIALVKRAVQSVLNQTISDFELIIVDDGSDIYTEQELFKIANSNQEKIIFIRHKNCGQSNSINRGVLNSNGSYISIIDADDEYKPNHLECCLLEMKYADLIASTTNTITDNDEDFYVPDKFDISKVIHVDECVLLATLFGKKEVFESEKFKNMYAADAHFYENASKKFAVNKVNLRTYIYYRNNPNSICSVLKSNQQKINNILS